MNALWVSLLLLGAGPGRQNVVVVAIDGLRPREVFSGAERSLMHGVENEPGLVAKYWRDDPVDRRAVLMPFLWRHLAKEGQVFGNAALGSPMQVTNAQRCSYPGYNEMLTGAPDARIDGNEHGDNENVTVLEWLSQRPDLRGDAGAVQVFATWETFFRIFNTARSGLDVRAGWNPPFGQDSNRTSAKDALDALYRTTTPLFGGNALDALTMASLNESLRTRRPRVLFVGLGETDEWQHAGRYDLTLEAIHRADAMVAELWATLQAMPEYQGSTTLIITTDHGRGTGPRDWREHGAQVRHAEEVWAAVMGPTVPAHGERRDTGLLTQGQVASTIAASLGHSWPSYAVTAPPPLPVNSPSVEWARSFSGRPLTSP